MIYTYILFLLYLFAICSGNGIMYLRYPCPICYVNKTNYTCHMDLIFLHYSLVPHGDVKRLPSFIATLTLVFFFTL